MSKINNKLILVSTILTLVLGFSFALPVYARNSATYNTGVTLDQYNYPNGYPNGYYPNTSSNILPVILSANPNSITRGSGPIIIAITGNYFVPGSIARWNGSDRTTTYVNSHYLQMQLTFADTDNWGDYLITVFSPSPGGGLSNTASLNISGGVQTNIPTRSVPITLITPSTSASSASKTSSTPPPAPAPDSEDELGANALSSGFLPSNIIQWSIFLILGLSAVALWRKIYVSAADKASALKHD